MKSVDIPGLGTVDFPDEMSDEDIGRTIEREILPSIKAQAEEQQRIDDYWSGRSEDGGGGEPGYLSNLVRGAGERALDLVGGGLRTVGTLAEAGGDYLERQFPLGTIGSPGTPMTEEQIQANTVPLPDWARTLSNVDLGYEPRTTFQDVKDNWANVVPFAFEQGVVSAPDMAGALLNPILYGAARTGEIAQTRAENDGRGSASVDDLIKAAPAAAASALLERFGARGMAGLGDDAVRSFNQLPGAMGRAAVKEGGTEFAQEISDYTGETLGTRKGFEAGEALERGIAGAVAGAPFGGGVRGVTGAVQVWAQERGVEPTQENLEAAAAQGDTQAIDILRAAGLMSDEQLANLSPEAAERFAERYQSRRAAEEDPILAAQRTQAAIERRDLEGGDTLPNQQPNRMTDQGGIRREDILKTYDVATQQVDAAIDAGQVAPEEREAAIRQRVVGLMPELDRRPKADARTVAAARARIDEILSLPSDQHTPDLATEYLELNNLVNQSERRNTIQLGQTRVDNKPTTGSTEDPGLAQAATGAYEAETLQRKRTEQAFKLARFRAGKAGDTVRDVRAGGRPEGGVESQQTIFMDEGRPVEILASRTVPDSNGNMRTVHTVRRFDPRTGQPDIDPETGEAFEYEVQANKLTQGRYAADPRQAQEFEGDPKFEDRGARAPVVGSYKDADGKTVKSKAAGQRADEALGMPRQTYRVTPPDPTVSGAEGPTSEVPGQGPVPRSPRPEQGAGPATDQGSGGSGPNMRGDQTSAEAWARREAARRERMREQARRGQTQDEAGAQTDWGKARNKYENQKTGYSAKPKGVDADGWPEIDEDGFVLSDKGGPIRFESKQALIKRLKELRAAHPDAGLSPAPHPGPMRSTGRSSSESYWTIQATQPKRPKAEAGQEQTAAPEPEATPEQPSDQAGGLADPSPGPQRGLPGPAPTRGPTPDPTPEPDPLPLPDFDPGFAERRVRDGSGRQPGRRGAERGEPFTAPETPRNDTVSTPEQRQADTKTTPVRNPEQLVASTEKALRDRQVKPAPKAIARYFEIDEGEAANVLATIAGRSDKVIRQTRDGRFRLTPRSDKQSLINLLASRGGLAPNGDLSAMDLDKLRTPGAGGMLVRKGGMTLDQARELAEEEGFLGVTDDYQSSDIQDLLDALENEHRGSKVKAERTGFGSDRDQMERRAEELGIEVNPDWNDAELMIEIGEADAIANADNPTEQAADDLRDVVDAMLVELGIFPDSYSADFDIPFGDERVTGSDQGAGEVGAASEGAPAAAPAGAGREASDVRSGDRAPETRAGDAQEAGRAGRQTPAVERTDQGDQYVLVGQASSRDGKQAAKGPQKEADQGLFAEPASSEPEPRQIDLEEAIAASRIQPIDPASVPDPVNGKPIPSDVKPEERLLLLSCGIDKDKSPGMLPAIARYAGPRFQDIRKWLGLNPGQSPKIVILSGKFNFIDSKQPIPDYDQAMTKDRAAKLIRDGAGKNGAMEAAKGPPGGYRDVMIVGGGEYNAPFNAAVTQLIQAGAISPNASIRRAAGGIGVQRQQMVGWLNKEGQAASEPDTDERLEELKDRVQIFASGMSAPQELNAGLQAWSGMETRGIGVEIGRLSNPGIETLAKAVVDRNAAVFVDSGAYGLGMAEMRGAGGLNDLLGELGPVKPKPIDFDEVLAKYDRIIDRIAELNGKAGDGTRDMDADSDLDPREAYRLYEDDRMGRGAQEDRQLPLFVMPDIVMDQRGSLDLAKRYREHIRKHTDLNVSRPIVPIQKGELSLTEAYAELVDTLGTDRFVVGIPAATKAVTDQELRAFLDEVKPARIHILGGASPATLDPKLRIIAEAGLDPEHVSADANILRAALWGQQEAGVDRKTAVRDTLIKRAGKELDEQVNGPAPEVPKKGTQRVVDGTIVVATGNPDYPWAGGRYVESGPGAGWQPDRSAGQGSTPEEAAAEVMAKRRRDDVAQKERAKADNQILAAVERAKRGETLDAATLKAITRYGDGKVDTTRAKSFLMGMGLNSKQSDDAIARVPTLDRSEGGAWLYDLKKIIQTGQNILGVGEGVRVIEINGRRYGINEHNQVRFANQQWTPSVIGMKPGDTYLNFNEGQRDGAYDFLETGVAKNPKKLIGVKFNEGTWTARYDEAPDQTGIYRTGDPQSIAEVLDKLALVARNRPSAEPKTEERKTPAPKSTSKPKKPPKRKERAQLLSRIFGRDPKVELTADEEAADDAAWKERLEQLAPRAETVADIKRILAENVELGILNKATAKGISDILGRIPTDGLKGVRLIIQDRMTAEEREILGTKKGSLGEYVTFDDDPDTRVLVVHGRQGSRTAVDTFVHENAHVLFDRISLEDKAAARRIYDSLPISRQAMHTVDYGKDERFEEWFAESMVDYYNNGAATGGPRGSLFHQLGGLAQRLYKRIVDVFSTEKALVDAFFSGLERSLGYAGPSDRASLDREVSVKGITRRERRGVSTLAILSNPIGTVTGDWKAWRAGAHDLARDVTEALQGKRPNRQTAAGTLARWWFYSADGEYRAAIEKFNSPTMNFLADTFHAKAGGVQGLDRKLATKLGMKLDSNATFDEAVTRKMSAELNQLSKILKPFDQDEDALDRIVDLVQRPSARRSDPESKAASEIARQLASLHRYMKDNGVELGEIKSGYFPREIDTGKVLKNTDGFVEAATKAYRASGLGAKDAKEAADRWLTTVLFGGSGSPVRDSKPGTPSFVQSRVLTKEADQILKDFYQRDPKMVLGNYIARATKRAEIARRFGDNWKNWDNIEKQIRAEDPAAAGMLDLVRNYAATAAGVRQDGVTGMVRSGASMVRTITSVSLLEKSTFSSLAEAIMPAIRSGSVLELIPSLTTTLREFRRNLSAMPPSVAAELAADIGAVAGSGVNSLMAARFAGGDPLGRVQAKVLESYFRRIGLTQWTDSTRIASTERGAIFIRRLARDIGGMGLSRKSSRLYMGELGIPAGQMDEFVRFVNSMGDNLPTASDLNKAGEMGAAYRTALLRFVDQTVMRPSTTTRPRWASHPLGSVLFQLQAFSYAFSKNVMLRNLQLAKTAATPSADLNAYDRLLLAAPLLMLLPLLGLTQALVGELRDWLFMDPERRAAQTTAAKVEKAISRAGFTGALDPYLQMITSARYSKDPLSTLTGPFLGVLGQGLGAAQQWIGNNSPNTNAAERKMTEALYDVVWEPGWNILLGFAPGSPLTTAITMGFLPSLRDNAVDWIAGERVGHRQQPVYGLSEILMGKQFAAPAGSWAARG